MTDRIIIQGVDVTDRVHRSDYELAKIVLTPNEYAAYELHARGMSQRTIAYALHISRSAVQSRLENARRKIHQARKDAA